MASSTPPHPTDITGACCCVSHDRYHLEKRRTLEAELAGYRHLLTEYHETYDEWGVPRDPQSNRELDMWHTRLEGLESMCEAIDDELSQLEASMADSGPVAERRTVRPDGQVVQPSGRPCEESFAEWSPPRRNWPMATT
jgi:hypothetical protein